MSSTDDLTEVASNVHHYTLLLDPAALFEAKN
jgi:hypothetical protein